MFLARKDKVVKSAKDLYDRKHIAPDSDLRTKKQTAKISINSKILKTSSQYQSQKFLGYGSPKENEAISVKQKQSPISKIESRIEPQTRKAKIGTKDDIAKKATNFHRNIISGTDQKLAMQLQKSHSLQEQLRKAEQNINELENRIIRFEFECDEKETANTFLKTENEQLNNKLIKMKRRESQNQKVLRQRISDFNQQSTTLLQLDSIRVQNQQLRLNLAKFESSESQSVKKMCDQGVETQQDRDSMKQSTTQSENCEADVCQINSHQIETIKQGYEALIKQLEAEFLGRAAEYQEQSSEQDRQVDKLEAIIDRHYEEQIESKLSGIKLSIDTDQALLQTLQQNSRLKDHNRTLKSQICLLKIENQRIQSNAKDIEVLFKTAQLKASGIMIKTDYTARDTRASSGSQERERDLKISALQLKQTKKLLEKYSEDNKNKDAIIKMLSTPRKNGIFK